ncbi:MAG: ribonuclease R, partial [Hyphomicrobium sp.]
MPTREEILDFVQSSQTSVGKREIARAFGIKGGDKIGLKKLLAEMTDDGTLSGNRKALKEKGTLPPIAALEVTGRDDDGDLVARPVIWDAEDGERPAVLLLPGRARSSDEEGAATEIGVGDRILARITKLDQPDVAGFRFEAEPIRKLPRDIRRLLGIFRASVRGGGSIEPVDRKQLRSFTIQKGDEGAAKDGDLVRFDLVKKGRMHVPMARVLESLGNPHDQRKISLIAIHAHGIPDDFPQSVIAETANLEPPSLRGREDLRHIPLLTIDPIDARDHDDAVHASPDTDPSNPG